MKKVIFSMVAATLMLVTMVGCKGGSSDPKAVAIAFIDKLKEKDFDGAAKYATKESKSALDMMKSAMKMAEAFGGGKGEDMDFDKEWKGKKVEFTEPKIEGDVATVSLMADGKEQMPIKLKKEDGAWKVAFDKNTLMQQGKDKMGEMKNQDIPSMDSALNNLNGMGDSIKNALDKAGKSIDSAKKIMEQK